MHDYYIGIDNGVTGSIAIMSMTGAKIFRTPTYKVRDYQKEEKYIKRINVRKLLKELEKYSDKSCKVTIERPMVNPKMFRSSVSALRAFEATILALEFCNLKYEVVDSKDWQKYILPNVKGRDNLKQESLVRGIKLYPELESQIRAIGDADSLLIAEYAYFKEYSQEKGEISEFKS